MRLAKITYMTYQRRNMWEQIICNKSINTVQSLVELNIIEKRGTGVKIMVIIFTLLEAKVFVKHDTRHRGYYTTKIG